MKNIRDKTKKWLTVTGLGIVCLVLVVAIYSQFIKETPADGGMTPGPVSTGEVNPNIDIDSREENNQVVIPIEPDPAPVDNTPAQTDQPVQNLQPDVTKPAEPTEGQKTDPTQKPDGEKVDNVNPTDHNNVPKPDAPQTGEPQGGEQKDGMVYLPGFGWVPETGGSGTSVDGEGDINKQVGNMD